MSTTENSKKEILCSNCIHTDVCNLKSFYANFIYKSSSIFEGCDMKELNADFTIDIKCKHYISKTGSVTTATTATTKRRYLDDGYDR